MRSAIRKNLADFLAILGVVVLGVGIGAYILANQRLRFPLIEDKPFIVKAELPDAQAVTPGQGQTIVVAGVRVGDIGKVELEDGRAVVELQLEPKYRGLLTDEASALLRAKTGTKDMFLEVDPGDGKPLPDGGRIKVANTLPDVDPDEFLAVLDADTRSYLKLLISGAGKGLEGRGTDLREVLKRLGPLHSEHRPAIVSVAHFGVKLPRVLAEPGEVLLVVRRVRDREEAVGAEPVGEQVVEHAPVVAAEHRVLGAALGDFRHIVREQPLEELLGLRPARLDLAHVRDVEHARAGAHGHVLLANPLVLHRHLPPGERHEARAGALMALEERRPAEGVCGGRQPPAGYPLSGAVESAAARRHWSTATARPSHPEKGRSGVC